MKNLLLIALLFAFLVCCQKNIENTDAQPEVAIPTQNTNTEAVNINKNAETQPVVSPTTLPTPTNDVYSKIGNTESGKQGICLVIQNPNLKTGDKVQIVLPELPQKVLEAEISGRIKCEDVDYEGSAGYDNKNVTSYLLRLSNKDDSRAGFGIGIVETAQKIRVVKGLANVDLDNDGKEEYFRECYGNESLHLFVWKGKPLIGKRIWYSYYSFNYGTEPTCKDKEFEGIEN